MAKAVLSEKGGSIFLALFGVPFFVVGILIIYFMALSPYLTLKSSDKWQEVNAQILDLKFSPDSEGEDIGERFSIEYSYDFQGTEYKSFGLFIDVNSPTTELAKEIYPNLKKAYDAKENISAFVNPLNPQQAVLFKELKDDILMMIIFGGVFALAGLAIITGGIFMYRSTVTKESNKSKNPDEPWMWDKTWRLGISKPERKSHLVVGFIFLCFWYGMAAVPCLALYEEFLEGGPIFYVGLIMSCLGFLFLYFYIKSVFKYRKYGQSYLELKTLPGRLGQEFKGEVYAPFFLRPEGDIYCSIDCKHHYYEGSHDSRRSKTDLLFKEKFTVDSGDARSSQEAFIIPISFKIPKDKPVSNDSIFWTLNVYAETVGLDWSETYKIPIYK